MADDPNKTGGQDRARVNKNQEHEVAYEAEKTGASPDRVRKAADAAGPMRKEIEKKLGKSPTRH